MKQYILKVLKTLNAIYDNTENGFSEGNLIFQYWERWTFIVLDVEEILINNLMQ